MMTTHGVSRPLESSESRITKVASARMHKLLAFGLLCLATGPSQAGPMRSKDFRNVEKTGIGEQAKVAGVQVFTKAGTNAEVAAAVDAFRDALGALSANNPGSIGGGRREINWDDVPDSDAAPNRLPLNFYNTDAPGRAGGVLLRTPGTGFVVSAGADNPTNTATNFENLNSQYAGQFRPFIDFCINNAIIGGVLDKEASYYCIIYAEVNNETDSMDVAASVHG